MTTSELPPAAWFDSLPIETARREALRERVAAVPAGCGIRAAFGGLVAPALRRVAPWALDRYQGYAEQFATRRSLFGFQPMRELMVMLGCASQLVWPQRSLDEASNALVEAAADLIWSVPVMGPFVASFDGDAMRLVETIASAGGIFYDHGHLEFERRAGQEALVTFDGQPADALRMWIPGFWAGTMRRLGLTAEVEYRVVSPTLGESRLRWGDARA